jgi:DNA-binding NtrC family response regulator
VSGYSAGDHFEVRVKRELELLVQQMNVSGITYAEAVREFKKRFILHVLAQNRGNQCKAAQEMGMHRNTLSRTMEELGINPAQVRAGVRASQRSGAKRPVRSEGVKPNNIARIGA